MGRTRTGVGYLTGRRLTIVGLFPQSFFDRRLFTAPNKTDPSVEIKTKRKSKLMSNIAAIFDISLLFLFVFTSTLGSVLFGAVKRRRSKKLCGNRPTIVKRLPVR